MKKQYGRWTVLNKVSNQKYFCKCSCGVKREVYKYSLTRGVSTSCGCLRDELVAKMGKKNKSHGMHNTRPYVSWKNMKSRCLNKKDKDFKRYGKRGIEICDRWLEFENFWEDMKRGYRKDLTLERVDNSKGYYKRNCRWATWREQANNKRGNRNITFKGKTQTVSKWAREIGLTYHNLRDRIDRRGWSLERALTTPKQR